MIFRSISCANKNQHEKQEALVFSRQLADIEMSLPQYIEAYETDDDERYTNILIYVIGYKPTHTATL